MGVPDEVRAALDPHLEYWEPFAPRWLELLTVRFKTDMDDDDVANAMLAIQPEPEYRQAKLFVYPKYLQQLPRDRKLAVGHELIHVAFRPVEEMFYTLLESTTDDGDVAHTLASRAYSLAMEGCVTDLELGLGRLLQSQPHRDGHE